jgi:hypothetical protein
MIRHHYEIQNAPKVLQIQMEKVYAKFLKDKAET